MIASVDTALRLLHYLRDEGTITVGRAAGFLGIAPSSAHRLLVTLEYRDFATRAEGRGFVAGPALSLRPGARRGVAELRTQMLPLMRGLAEDVGETVSLSIRIGTAIRVVATAETSRLLRVGDQEGTVLPAHRTAAGKVLLAAMTDQSVLDLYRGASSRRRPDLHELATVRAAGFALNHGDAEPGVSAVAIPLPPSEDGLEAALAVVLPSARFDAADVTEYVARCRARRPR